MTDTSIAAMRHAAVAGFIPHPKVPRRPADGVPTWMLVGAAALILSCILPFWTSLPSHTFDGVVAGAFVLRLLLEGWTYWWASERADLPIRMRQTLRVFAVVSAISVCNSLSEAVVSLGVPALPQSVHAAWVILSFAARTAAVFWYPSRENTDARGLLLTDIGITLAGYGTLFMVLVTVPSLAAATGGNWWNVFSGAFSQAFLLIGLNVLVMRGVAFPSRRAFWWFVTGTLLYLPNQLLAQLGNAEVIAYGWSAAVYQLAVLPAMVAAYFIRTDPITASEPGRVRPWYSYLNPIPLSAPVAVGVFLAVAVLRDTNEQVGPLSVALIVSTALLVLRSVLAGRETARVAAAERATALRMDHDKLEAVGRLAGGIAHEFNNAMTVVLGSAELGADDVTDRRVVSDSFAMIRDAGTRVSTITARLQLATGTAMTARRDHNLCDVVRAAVIAVSPVLPSGSVVSTTALDDVGLAPVDDGQLTMLLHELLANAAVVPSPSGRVAIGLSRRDIDTPLHTDVATIPAGAYAALTITDDGPGIPRDALRKLFEPFYSTQSFDAGRGLGLAVVRGIAIAHAGGVQVDSMPTRGTTITVLLPLSVTG